MVDMKNKHKLVSVGKGLKLYRVVLRDNEKLGTIAIVSGNLGTKEMPWTVRWTDFMSTEHTVPFRTKMECVQFIHGGYR